MTDAFLMFDKRRKPESEQTIMDILAGRRAA
jgi:hypothetical protein